jgi:hypothetical protein
MLAARKEREKVKPEQNSNIRIYSIKHSNSFSEIAFTTATNP